MRLVVYLLASFGLAYIVGHSTISLPFRVWLGGVPPKMGEDGKLTLAKPGALGPAGDFLITMVECPACFGFWIGLASGFVIPSMGFAGWAWPLVLGCATSGSNFIVGRLTKLV